LSSFALPAFRHPLPSVYSPLPISHRLQSVAHFSVPTSPHLPPPFSFHDPSSFSMTPSLSNFPLPISRCANPVNLSAIGACRWPYPSVHSFLC
jgi:hypothetical protein